MILERLQRNYETALRDLIAKHGAVPPAIEAALRSAGFRDIPPELN